MNNEEKERLLGMLPSYRQRFMNIPRQLWKYIENAIKKNVKDNLLSALTDSSPMDVLRRIDEIFVSACFACGLDSDTLTQRLNFNPNDIGEGRMDAFLAEVRVINRLHNWGFYDITALYQRTNKSAEFYCKHKNDEFVIEVFCSPMQKYRYPGHDIRSRDLIRYYENRAIEKRSQLDKSASDKGCQNKILCLVFNSLAGQAMLTKSDFLGFLKRIDKSLNWGLGYYYMIVTGMRSWEGEDDCIYPNILESKPNS